MVVAVSLIPLLGALISFGVWLATLLIPSKRRRAGVYIGLVNLCTGLWLLAYTVELNVATWFAPGSAGFERVAVFWFVVRSFASTAVALYWFLFAMENAGYQRWSRGWALWAQHLIAFVVAFAYASSPIQGWIYRDFVPGEISHLAGPGQPIADGIVYAWTVTALIVFVVTATRNPLAPLRRLAYAVAGMGTLVLIGSAVWSYRAVLDAALSLDPALMFIPALNVTVVYYVFRAGLVEFRPVSAEATFRSLSDAVIVADYAGNIVSFNDAAHSVFPDATPSDSILRLLEQGGLASGEYESWDRTSGEMLEFETTTDGVPYWVRVTPMDGRYRWQQGTLVLASDISRLRGAEREIREANRQLVEAQATRERFLRNVGRELRSPIETIIGMSDVLLQELPGPLNEEQRSQLTLVQDSGNRLLQVFDRILHLAAAQDEQIEIRYEDVDVCVVAQDIARSLRPMATRKSVNLIFKSNLDSCRIRCDIAHIRSILDNLVSNAIEYTDDGSVTVTTFVGVEWVEVDVADTGRGIPVGLQERVFEEFGHTEDEDPASPQQGAHIGLALSRQLARRLGGDITVESTPGIGSRFRLRLPHIEA
jgi:signal transduction histidine kinase